MELTTVILAGGLGTRLSFSPKVLAPVEDKPFVTYLLDKLSDAGIEDVVICIGHKGQEIMLALGDTYGKCNLKYSYETSQLGTGGALRLAMPMLNTNPVLVMNGDTWCDVDLEDFYHRYKLYACDVSIVNAQHGRGAIDSAGVYLFSRYFVSKIPANMVVSLEERISREYKRPYLYYFGNHFIDIGTPEEYAKAEQFFQAVRDSG